MGLENAPEALLDLFHGKNQGKLIVKIGGQLTHDERSSEDTGVENKSNAGIIKRNRLRSTL